MNGLAIIFAASIIGAAIHEGCTAIADAISELIEEPENTDSND